MGIIHAIKGFIGVGVLAHSASDLEDTTVYDQFPAIVEFNHVEERRQMTLDDFLHNRTLNKRDYAPSIYESDRNIKLSAITNGSTLNLLLVEISQDGEIEYNKAISADNLLNHRLYEDVLDQTLYNKVEGEDGNPVISDVRKDRRAYKEFEIGPMNYSVTLPLLSPGEHTVQMCFVNAEDIVSQVREIREIKGKEAYFGFIPYLHYAIPPHIKKDVSFLPEDTTGCYKQTIFVQ